MVGYNGYNYPSFNLDKNHNAIKSEKLEVKKIQFACDKCDFIAKNANGLRLHNKKHAK